jgi:hypothetical protein
MPYVEGQQSLMDYWSSFFEKYYTQKTLFGKQQITLFNTCVFKQHMFEMGAILGRARQDRINVIEKILGRTKQDKINVLEKILGIPTTNYIEVLQLLAKDMLDEFEKCHGCEPKQYLEFIFFTESRKLGGPCSPDESEKRKTVVLSKRHSFESKWAEIGVFGHLGIGFGSLFPDLTLRLHNNSYPNVKIEQQQETVLIMTAKYVLDNYPELIDEFNFHKYETDLRKP